MARRRSINRMLTKPIRRLVAHFAIAVMAFGQFAMTGYACPVQGVVPPVATLAAQEIDAVAGPCAGMNVPPATSQANACEFHCTDGVTLPAQPDLPLVALTALPAPAIVRAVLATTDGAARTPLAALPGAPPLILQFCRLLI